MNDPLTITQVLCTRLCHDLAGPIGAVGAGVELVGGDPSQVDAETLQLIADSSGAASRKLKFFRLALGTSGGAAALNDFQATVAGYFEAIAGPSGKAELVWPSAQQWASLSHDKNNRAAQLLINVILMATEVVPRVRRVVVNVELTGATLLLSVDAMGDISANLDPRRDLVALLANSQASAVTPKTVQPLYALLLAGQAAAQLSAEAIEGGMRVTAALPVGP